MIDAAFRGWFMAWIVWSAVPVGALVFVMIHAVTGGRWGEALAPTLRPAVALVPLAALGFLGVAAGLRADFPWAAGAGGAKPDVVAYYLNPAAFLVRAGVTLVGWSVLAGLVLTGRMGKLAAALGLTFYGLTISLVSVDWLLSVEPGFNSSAFAASIAIHQLLASLAWCALAGRPRVDERDASDLAGLMLACLLGVLYLGLMSFIVAWYGDLPSKAAWYLKRGAGVWGDVLIVALLVGGVLPFVALLFARVRRSAAGLRAVGALVLAGVGLHFAWYVLPAYGDGAGSAAGAAVLALTILMLLSRPYARLLGRRAGGLRHA